MLRKIPISTVKLLPSFNLVEKSMTFWTSKLHSKVSPKFTASQQLVNVRFLSNFKRDLKNPDKYESQICSTLIAHKYTRLLKLAVREKGRIVKTNPRLEDVINHAKQYMPPDFINFNLRLSCDIRAVSGLYDLFFSGRSHFIVQYEDIDPTITKHHLLELCDKYDGNLIQGEVKWQQNFHQKGIISVRCSQSELFSQKPEDQILSSIKAESLHEEVDAEGCEYVKVYCDPWKLHDVKSELSQLTPNIEEAYVGFIPKEEIYLPHHMKNHFVQVFGELSKVPTIDNVYVNFSLFK